MSRVELVNLFAFLWFLMPLAEHDTLLIENSTAVSKSPLLQAPPEHIAIIMDGNRRWAKKHRLPANRGHSEGADNLTKIVEYASDLGVSVLTVYSFSTENWKRSIAEVSHLMSIIQDFLEKKRALLVSKGIRLTMIGDVSAFPLKVKTTLEKTISATQEGTGMNLVLAMGYGGRNELCRAVKRIVKDVQSGQIHEQEISEELIKNYLDTRFQKDPDLLIRTGGEYRLSNFLLWQLAYTEFVISPVLWPDFTKQHLKEAIETYQNRMRRHGK